MKTGVLAAFAAMIVACSSPDRDPCQHGTGTLSQLTPRSTAIHSVFLILMENKNWSPFYGSPPPPFTNGALLPQSSYAPNYAGSLPPSEPNYLWLEGGTGYGIDDDGDPAEHHVANRDH